MQEFDFYINLKKPTLGLYVRNGAGLPPGESARVAI
jgi:hypothetical protein